MWYQIALRLGKTVQEVMRMTTMSEFYEWQVIIEEDINRSNLEHSYMQRVAYEIRMSNQFISKEDRKNTKLSDFRITTTRSPKPETEETLIAKLKAKATKSKNYWKGVLGFGKKLKTRKPNKQKLKKPNGNSNQHR